MGNDSSKVVSFITGSVAGVAAVAMNSATVADIKDTKRQEELSACAGIIGGGIAGALHQFFNNLCQYGNFDRNDFFAVMKSNEVTVENTERLWKLLCDNDIVINEKVGELFPKGIAFPEDLEPYRKLVESLVNDSFNIIKGVNSALTENAELGGLSAVFAGTIYNDIQKYKVEVKARDHAVELKQGKQCGSIEIHAYCMLKNKRIIVNDSKCYGPQSDDGGLICLKFSEEDEHYSPNVKDGEKLDYISGNNCLFESIAFFTDENPASLRDEVIHYIEKNALKLEDIDLEEFYMGGMMHGGGGISEAQRKNVLDAISQYINKTKEELQSSVRKVNLGRKGGRNNAHVLTRDLNGLYVVDAYYGEHDSRPKHRGNCRVGLRLLRNNRLLVENFFWDHYKDIETSKVDYETFAPSAPLQSAMNSVISDGMKKLQIMLQEKAKESLDEFNKANVRSCIVPAQYACDEDYNIVIRFHKDSRGVYALGFKYKKGSGLQFEKFFLEKTRRNANA